MAIQSKKPKSTSKRKKSQNRHRGPTAARRLQEAFAILTGRPPASDGRQHVTAAELCRIARVSRNSLYRYHTDLVETLRQYQEQHLASRAATQGRPKTAIGELTALREQLSKLASLVDHYYGAYRETYDLLKRRERELANLRRSLDSRPLALVR